MQSTRKFTKTTFTVTVFSEGPYDPKRLTQIADDLAGGPTAGTWCTEKVETLSAADTAKALVDVDTDPGMFGLTAAGEDFAAPAAAEDDTDPDAWEAQPDVTDNTRYVASIGFPEGDA